MGLKKKNYKLIKLRGKNGEGKFAIVDEEDFEKLNQYKWFVNKHGYIMATIPAGYRKTKNVQMHRFILEVTNPNVIVDHKNRNKFDNRKGNLNPTNRSANAANVIFNNPNKKSKYIGVVFRKESGKWQANFKYQGRSFYCGCYENEEDAAKARDYWVELLFPGLFVLNHIDLNDFIPKPVRGLNSQTSSRFIGVYKTDKKNKKWRAKIAYKGNEIQIGYFENETEAALAYNLKAKELFGDNAILNDIATNIIHPDNIDSGILLAIYSHFFQKAILDYNIPIKFDETNINSVNAILSFINTVLESFSKEKNYIHRLNLSDLSLINSI